MDKRRDINDIIRSTGLTKKEIQDALADEILFHFYRIHNDLGYGFLERVYQKALCYALTDVGLNCEMEKCINVYHDGRIVGDYRADMLVEDIILLEIKACENLIPAHEAQLINYLKATDIEVGYVLNFGKSAVFSRKIYTNDRKNRTDKGFFVPVK